MIGRIRGTALAVREADRLAAKAAAGVDLIFDGVARVRVKDEIELGANFEQFLPVKPIAISAAVAKRGKGFSRLRSLG